MKIVRVVLAAGLLVGPCAGFAEVAGTCASPMETPAKSGAMLSIELRPAGLDVVGTGQDKIKVTCTLDSGDDASHVVLRISGTGDYKKLTIEGGPRNNVRIRVEVPRKTSLRIRTEAGQVNVSQVVGDKDISLYAGEINLAQVKDTDYRSINASVQIGDVNAPAFGVEKGGFFRRFERTTPGGLYRLRAHVTTGSIQLN
jgi:hypothetical protein